MVTRRESNYIVIAALLWKASGAENLDLIYCRVWIYVPTLNRKISDLRPPPQRQQQRLGLETALYQNEFLLLSLCAGEPPRIYNCRGYNITMFLNWIQVQTLGNYPLSEISCSLWETLSNRLLDFISCCVLSNYLMLYRCVKVIIYLGLLWSWRICSVLRALWYKDLSSTLLKCCYLLGLLFPTVYTANKAEI